jgi:hypothetical protein
MILEATVQKLWVFEVFGQGLTRVDKCWSQPVSIDHLHKKWRAGEKTFSKINGQIGPVQVSACGWLATSGRPPGVG